MNHQSVSSPAGVALDGHPFCLKLFNVSLLQDKVDEAEAKLQEALDCKDELESGGEHYSEATMRRCERKIFT